jgi:hypothetical protein
LDEAEQALAAFDPSKLPRDIKREAREEWHYMLWLQGRKYREIEAITGFERSCIGKDIRRVQDRLALTPRDMEDVRQMALMSLRITRSEVMHSIRVAHESKGGRGQVPWGHIAKLYDVAAGIDETILARYTQTGGAATASALADFDKAKIIMDYMVSKYGPESLDGFEEYYTRQMALKKSKPIEVEAEQET